MQLQKHLPTILLSTVLVLFGITARILPHPANVAPITAIALFGGLYLPKRVALILPVLTLLASDLIIGFYHWQTMIAVYASFLLCVGIGYWIAEKKSFARVLGATLLSSVLFFLITNAAVWAFDKMYPLTFAGLMQSYEMAIPFFKNSLIGDIFYTALFIGTAEFLLYITHLSSVTHKKSGN